MEQEKEAIEAANNSDFEDFIEQYGMEDAEKLLDSTLKRLLHPEETEVA